MRKALVLLLLVVLAVSLIAITGCGDDETTIKTPEGEVTFEEDGGSVTIETEEGDVTYEGTDRPPTEEELGVAVYPGADYVEGSGAVTTVSTPEGEATTATAQYVTDDDFGDVVAFYEGELGRPLVVEEISGQATWTETMGDGTVIVVDVSSEDGEITITLGRTAGMGL